MLTDINAMVKGGLSLKPTKVACRISVMCFVSILAALPLCTSEYHEINSTLLPFDPLDTVTRHIKPASFWEGERMPEVSHHIPDIALAWDDLTSRRALWLDVRVRRPPSAYLSMAFQGDPHPNAANQKWEQPKCVQSLGVHGDILRLEQITNISSEGGAEGPRALNLTLYRYGTTHKKAARFNASVEHKSLPSSRHGNSTTLLVRMADPCESVEFWPVQLVIAARPQRISVYNVSYDRGAPWSKMLPTGHVAWNCRRTNVTPLPSPDPMKTQLKFEEVWKIHAFANQGPFTGNETFLPMPSDVPIVFPPSLGTFRPSYPEMDKDVVWAEIPRERMITNLTRKVSVPFPVADRLPAWSRATWTVMTIGIEYHAHFRGLLTFRNTTGTVAVTGTGSGSIGYIALSFWKYESIDRGSALPCIATL